MKKMALCLHDARVSGGMETERVIRTVLERFHAPLTVHLVFDEPLSPEAPLFRFLSEHADRGSIEVVFHGLTHRCPEGTGRWLAFYHKYQAEYLLDSEALRHNTGQAFTGVTAMFGMKTGLCPPCWLASRRNRLFFATLTPLYVESLFSLRYGSERISSPVLSLGSPVPGELFFLRLGARMMYLLSLVKRRACTRMAVHVCDLEVNESIDFFSDLFAVMKKRGFRMVLQRDLRG
jgi:hypothetical protein